jgi:hypothetical protein
MDARRRQPTPFGSCDPVVSDAGVSRPAYFVFRLAANDVEKFVGKVSPW